MHGFLRSISTLDLGERTELIPSQGSGSILAARSSIENLMSWPLSKRDSGSAFISQYRCVVEVSPLESLEAVCWLVVGYASYNEYQQYDLLKNNMESP